MDVFYKHNTEQKARFNRVITYIMILFIHSSKSDIDYINERNQYVTHGSTYIKVCWMPN